MRYVHTLALAIASLLAANIVAAQSALVMQQDCQGRIDLVPDTTLPEAHGWIAGQTNGCGIDWWTVTAPVHALVDGNFTPLAQTVETLQMDFGMEISQPPSPANVGTAGVDPAYRPVYTDLELNQMGAVTASNPQTLGSTLTEGAGYVQKTVDGKTRTRGHTFIFKCTAITLNNTKAYCIWAGGAATTTQDNAEMLLGRGCSNLRTISTTWYDNAGTARSASPSCSVTVGMSIDNSDTGTLITVSSTTSSASATPGTATSWTSTNEISTWINGNCSAATRSVMFAFVCD